MRKKESVTCHIRATVTWTMHRYDTGMTSSWRRSSVVAATCRVRGCEEEGVNRCSVSVHTCSRCHGAVNALFVAYAVLWQWGAFWASLWNPVGYAALVLGTLGLRNGIGRLGTGKTGSAECFELFLQELLHLFLKFLG